MERNKQSQKQNIDPDALNGETNFVGNCLKALPKSQFYISRLIINFQMHFFEWKLKISY